MSSGRRIGDSNSMNRGRGLKSLSSLGRTRRTLPRSYQGLSSSQRSAPRVQQIQVSPSVLATTAAGASAVSARIGPPQPSFGATREHDTHRGDSVAIKIPPPLPVAEGYTLVIAALPWPIRAAIIRRLLLAFTLALGGSLLASWLVIDSHWTQHVIRGHEWVLIVIALQVFLVLLTYRYCYFQPRRLLSQLVLLILGCLMFTIAMCGISVFRQTHNVLRAIAIALATLQTLWPWTFQTRIPIEAKWAQFYVGAWALLIAIVFVGLPNETFFIHPGTRWLDPPEGLQEAVVLFLSAGALSVFLVYDLEWVQRSLTSEQTILACTRMFANFVHFGLYLLSIAMATITLCASATGPLATMTGGGSSNGAARGAGITCGLADASSHAQQSSALRQQAQKSLQQSSQHQQPPLATSHVGSSDTL